MLVLHTIIAKLPRHYLIIFTACIVNTRNCIRVFYVKKLPKSFATHAVVHDEGNLIIESSYNVVCCRHVVIIIAVYLNFYV